MIRIKSIQAGLLATAILFMSGTAAADTVDFTDNGTFSTASLTEGIVTVTGSNNVQVVANFGLGIVGGVSSSVVDPGETMSFSFVDPVTNVVISDFQSFDADDDGFTAPFALFESFAGNGSLINSVWHAIEPSSPINVSEILALIDPVTGIPDAVPFFTFSITMNTDAILIGNVSYMGPDEGLLLSCSGFNGRFSDPISINRRARGVIPVSINLTDVDGFEVTDLDIVASPVINVEFNGVVYGDAADDVGLEPVGGANAGNSFTYNYDTIAWEYRLGTRQFSEAGTYTVTVKSGDETEYSIEAPSGQCEQTFTRQP